MWLCVQWKLPLGSPGHIAISQRAKPRLPELQGGGDATPLNPLLPTPRDWEMDSTAWASLQRGGGVEGGSQAKERTRGVALYCPSPGSKLGQ